MNWDLVALFIIVALGSSIQRISGMGLGIVGGPFMSLAFGPVKGIFVTNVLAMVNASFTTASVHKRVTWRYFWQIAPATLLGIIPGAFVVRIFPASWLMIIAGSLLLIALSVVTLGNRYVPRVTGTASAVGAGMIAGFMNALAGIAGPAITVYAHAARWEQTALAATLQPIFIVTGFGSFSVKAMLGAMSFSAIDPWIWPVGVVALFLGLRIGGLIAPRVSRGTAHTMALGLAGLGGLITVVRGVVVL